MNKEQALLVTKEELIKEYMLDRNGEGLKVFQRGQYVLDYDNVKDLFYLTASSGKVEVVEFERARDFVLGFYIGRDKEKALENYYAILIIDKINRLEKINIELKEVTHKLEEEKKQLESEIKKELQKDFNGETVYARGENISYYLYERTTNTIDKKKLEQDGVDVSKYTKTTKSIVLSNQPNSKIEELKSSGK